MKTAEELFNEYFSEAGQTLKVWFIEALTEHDKEIISKIDEMIETEKLKEFEIEDMLLFEIHCKVEALTELKQFMEEKL